jgi:large subunit ribosomal protein L19e
MDLKVQKRLAAQIIGCSPKKVSFDVDRLEDIKKAITKRDLRLLIGAKAITSKPIFGGSRSRARKLKIQKSKGRRKGEGSKKGSFNSRFHTKKVWMASVRVQRKFLLELLEKDIITRVAYRELYLKSKGGYFRSRRHIKLYLVEHDNMLVKNGQLKADLPNTVPAKKTKAKAQ